jgi:hypothetical protein
MLQCRTAGAVSSPRVGLLSSRGAALVALTSRASPRVTEDTSSAVRRRLSLEIVGYVVIALGLTVLLLLRVRHVDGFYLDEWLYTQAAEHVWANLPLGPIEQIPGWTRGAQRLYTLLLASSWGPLAPSAAYTVSHFINVVLLVSAVWPAALIARRVVESAWLRVLAVALAVAVPWLLISANLLTENLAFPLFLWTCVAIIVAAERPRPPTQLAALASVVALTLCRLNLAVMFGVLLIVVLGAELQRLRLEPAPSARRVRTALRRQWVIAIAATIAIPAGLLVFLRGGSSLGYYDSVTADTIADALWGSRADDTGRTILTYVRSAATGSFVFPLLLGLGASLAGTRGRLGQSVFVPALTALTTFVIVAISVSVIVLGAPEERYAFYLYPPVAILAVAGLEHIRRILPDLFAAGALIALAMGLGLAFPGVNSGNFFAAPAGAFWSRVVDHRLRALENDVLGWLPGAGEGWLIVALAMVVAIALALLLLRRDRDVAAILALGLGLCVVAQISVLGYDFGKLLYGTPEAPGGLAVSSDRARDRDDWIDNALPEGAEAAIVPTVTTPAFPYGDAERQEFWNEKITAVVALRFANAPVPAPPGIGVVEADVGSDGLAVWRGPDSDWFAAQPDDPRVQFPGRRVATSATTPLALWRAQGPGRAIWTGGGLEADGALLAGRSATLTLNRARASRVRSVKLLIRAPDASSGGVAWRLASPSGRKLRSGRLKPGAQRTLTLAVPRCGEKCGPVAWQLDGRGAPAPQPEPRFGPPSEARPVLLHVLSARLSR